MHMNRFLNILNETAYVGCTAPDLGGARGPGPGPPTKRGPHHVHMFICATCACHLILFIEESLFVGDINYRLVRRQYFTS